MVVADAAYGRWKPPRAGAAARNCYVVSILGGGDDGGSEREPRLLIGRPLQSGFAVPPLSLSLPLSLTLPRDDLGRRHCRS